MDWARNDEARDSRPSVRAGTQHRGQGRFACVSAQPLIPNRRPPSISSLVLVPEQRLRQIDKIPPPDHHRMLSRRFKILELDAFRLQPVSELPVMTDQAVFHPTRYPEQPQLRCRLRIQPRENVGKHTWI